MNILDFLNLERMDVVEEQREIVSQLKKFGLSDYEAKAYLALVMRGFGTAEEVADVAGIPRTSTYKTLDALQQKGYVVLRGGRPTVFRPVPPTEVKERLCSHLDSMFSKLEALQGMLSERGTPQLIYTIAGKDKVLSKIGEMLDASQHHFIISSPSIRMIGGELEDKFKEALKRGVDVLVVAEPSSRTPEGVRVLRKPDLIATDVISDGEMAMIASPDLALCGFTDNPFLALHLENFINLALEKGGT
jgi:sugar-specific transcriptional regulator TrmB